MVIIAQYTDSTQEFFKEVWKARSAIWLPLAYSRVLVFGINTMWNIEICISLFIPPEAVECADLPHSNMSQRSIAEADALCATKTCSFFYWRCIEQRVRCLWLVCEALSGHGLFSDSHYFTTPYALNRIRINPFFLLGRVKPRKILA